VVGLAGRIAEFHPRRSRIRATDIAGPPFWNLDPTKIEAQEEAYV
jgi:hypothetical protein